MGAIFISYRRNDAEGQAGRLYDDLVKQFGENAVFMDVVGIEVGRDFRLAIDKHVASCTVLLALIGTDWADARDADGKRRLDDVNDFVRLEISSALKRDIPVIPVLVRGAKMPRLEQLPLDCQELCYRNGVELTHARWDSDADILIKALGAYVKAESKDSPNTKSNTSASKAGQAKLGLSLLLGVILIGIGFISMDYFGNKESPSSTQDDSKSLPETTEIPGENQPALTKGDSPGKQDESKPLPETTKTPTESTLTRTYNALQGPPVEQELKDFVKRFLSAMNAGNVPDLLSFYGDTVDYYKIKQATQTDIGQDKVKYYEEWKMNTELIHDNIAVTPISGEEWEVSLMRSYSIQPIISGKPGQGIAETKLRIQRGGAGFKIVSEHTKIAPNTKPSNKS